MIHFFNNKTFVLKIIYLNLSDFKLQLMKNLETRLDYKNCINKVINYIQILSA